jgi:hypothetical protein
MTSLKQIEANRRNAQKSTGPRSETGKQRASLNALRHGLTAETVVVSLEDPEDYKLFEEAIAAEYDAESAVERELVLRLANLLWRLRRATSIETTLFELAGEMPLTSEETAQAKPTYTVGLASFPTLVGLSSRAAHEESQASLDAPRELASRFLRLAKLDDVLFERLNRYELALWRQTRQTLFMLELLRWTGRGSPRYAGPHFRRQTEDLSSE